MKFNTASSKRVVIKVGSSTLTHGSGYINIRLVERLSSCLADLHNSGREIILVSSGAVSCGLAKTGFRRDTLTTEQKQAAAAVGQCVLLDMYARRFAEYGITIAQILLTRNSIDEPGMRSHAATTLELLLSQGIIPIVNESNDTLASAVAVLVGADLLINMSDIDGLYTADPRKNPDAEFVPVVDNIDDSIASFAKGAGTERGTGGMIAKIESAKTVCDAGIPMVIVNGQNPDILYNVFDGDFKGTYFTAKEK